METVTETQRKDSYENSDGSDTYWNWKQYTLTAVQKNGNAFPFKKSYVKAGVTLQARFISPEDAGMTPAAGAYKLAGMTFDVLFGTDAEGNPTYTLKRNETYGAKLPNETLSPSVGDPFVLLGWDVNALPSLGLVESAEDELASVAAEYMQALEEDRFVFRCSMFSTSMKALDAMPEFGRKVRVSYGASGDKVSRILGYTFKLDMPWDSPEYEVGETDVYSRLRQLEEKMAQGGGSAGGTITEYTQDDTAGTSSGVDLEDYLTAAEIAQIYATKDEIPTSFDWSLITGKPSTLESYGISDALISGSSSKTITLGSSSVTIPAWALTNTLAFSALPNLYLAGTQVRSTAGSDTILGVTAISNALSSGDSDKSRIVWDESNKAWHFLGNVYADGWISALGAGSGSGSGGGADLSDVWDSLMTNDQTDDYYNRKIDIGHIPAFSISQSGTGNVVSGLSYSNGTFTLTKTQVSTALADLTGADDLRAIEALTGTGLLKRIGDNRWELDNSSYVTTSALNTALTSYVTTSALNTTLASYVTTSSLATTLGDYVTDSALALWTGSSKIDTVGTIESGEWQGTPIANAYLANPSVTVGSASITLGNSATLAEIGVTETYLTGLLNSDYHPYGGANDLDLVARYVTASTLTASGAISGGNTINAANSITVGNGSTATTSAAASKRRIYFGSSSYYLELAYDSTLAQFYLHTNAGFAADSFVSALGVGTPSGGGSGGGGIPHVLLTETEYEALVTGGSVDDGVIYLVYEDES